MSRAFWTNDRIDRAISLFRNNHSVTQIAEIIGASSRNAVAGKLHRMGVTKPLTEEARNIGRSVAVRKSHAGASQARAANFGDVRAPTPPRAPTILRIDDMDRTDGFRICDEDFGGCKWPIGGSGADTRFCCRETDHGGGSYCPSHHKVAHDGAKIQLTPEEIKSTERLFTRAA